MNEYKKLIKALGFSSKENTSEIFIKKYADGYILEIDFQKQTFYFGGKIKVYDKNFQNITKPEDWVVLECVDRLLEKGYKPEDITLEKVFPSGHGHSGRLDIFVEKEGRAFLMIECKTWGTEFEKEYKNIKANGGQLFTYFQNDKNTKFLILYTSQFNEKENEIRFRNEIVIIEDAHKETANVKDFFERWNKFTKNNGIFEQEINTYSFESKALCLRDIKNIQQEDSSFIFNQFLEILRHNAVSDKPNAFNKIFTLFLCKVKDEDKKDNEELEFQWREGEDDNVSFQKRLSDLYKKAMKEFLDKEVSDFSDDDFELKYKHLSESDKKNLLLEITKLRLQKNNEFAIKDVFDEETFKENSIVLKEVVELLQNYRFRYNKKQPFLGDFFELLLTTGLKQESGQFFTPVPVARFICKSVPIKESIVNKLHKGETKDWLPNIIDYAAGSGHFLTESMEEVQNIIEHIDLSQFSPKTQQQISNWKTDQFSWAFDYIYGIERDYRLVKTTKVGCYLHGDGVANVIHGDGLDKFESKKYRQKLSKKINESKDNAQFDFVLSNPPYSVPSFKGNTEASKETSDLYSFLTDTSSEIECLFIERTKQLLKDGGVAGIILPSSILSNTGIYSKSREIILQYFDIVAIAELGSNTFMATGTNTVTLFLRRRNNYESANIKIAVEKFFTNFQDVTTNGIEKPVAKYINRVWKNITFDDYVSLLKKEPNKAITEHEIYKEYQKKLKAKNDKEFWNLLLEKEVDKLYYFIIAYPQKVVLVKSGEKDAEKRFLGYEFSNRRGSEGIHSMQRGKNIEDCTQMFDAEVSDNPTKASTYIYEAFQNDYTRNIDEVMQNNVSRHNLVDMLAFDRVEFEKNISLSVKKKVRLESKWELKKLGELVENFDGKRVPLSKRERITGVYPYYGATGIIDYVNDYIFNEKLILIGEDGAKWGANENSAFSVEGKYWVNNHAHVLKPNRKVVLDKFLIEVLNEFDLSDYVTGLNVPKLNQGNLNEIQIPLPPLNIQQKIVSEIEVLESKEKKAKEEVESLKNSINDFFTTTTKSQLKNLLIEINPSKSESVKLDDDVNVSFLSMADVSNEGQIINLQTKKLKEVKSGFTFFQENDVLVAKITPCTENGKGALVSRLENNIGFGSTEFFVLRTDKEKLLPKILFHFTQSKDFRIDAEKEMTGASGHRRVPKSFVENYEIPLPLIAEQQKIVSEIEKIKAKITTLETEIATIPKFKEAILKKYL